MHSQFVVTTVSPAASLPLPHQVLLLDDGDATGCSESCARSPFDPEFFPDPPDLFGGPRIIWSAKWSPESRSPVIGTALDDFIRLANGRPDQIAAFARRWGVIGFCDQRWTPDLRSSGNLPGDHCHLEVEEMAKGRAVARCTRDAWRERMMAISGTEEIQKMLADPNWMRPDWYWEPVVLWREYSRGFRTILHLAGCVGEGRRVDVADIAAARRFHRLLIDCEGCGDCDDCQGIEDEAYLSVESARDLVITLTNELLALGQFYPRLIWELDDSAPSVVMDLSEGEGCDDVPPYGFLFPALVSRLCATLASPLGIYQCDACGSPFSPLKRRPRADRRRYCPPCSLDASLASKREWWRRNRSPAARTNGEPERRIAEGSQCRPDGRAGRGSI